MYCPTCGAFVAPNRAHCTECGTRVEPSERAASTAPVRLGSEDRRWMVDRSVGLCPRCSYRGEGISYFSRGIHAAGLVGVSVVTAGAMGAGGLIYYLMRKDHRVCPRCGRGWGRYGERSLPVTATARAVSSEPRLPPVRREGVRRAWSVLFFLFAVIMMIGAIAGGGGIGAALLGAASGAGGWALHRSANLAREERRTALIAELQMPVLRLAAEHGGRLTVTDVASEMGWPMRRAEKVLESLDDGLRVNSDVTDEGVIVYEFLEVMHSPRRVRGGERDEPPAAQA